MTQLSLRYGTRAIAFSVQRKAARSGSIAIHVRPNGGVVVDAPIGASVPNIKQAVQKRARWILRQLDSVSTSQGLIAPRQYVGGETHLYQGRRYSLKLLKGSVHRVRMQGSRLQVTTEEHSASAVRDALQDWYRTRAAQYFEHRLGIIAPELAWIQAPVKWKLLAMTKQWGSCSPGGVVALNPHLVKAPRECIDYVILHELCHLKEHNHSPQFYRLLDRAMPDWQARKAKLDNMAEMLLG